MVNRKEWQKVKISEIAEIIMGQSPKSEFYNSEQNGLPFFQGCADFGELYPNVRVWSKALNKIAEKDDVLMSVRAPVGDLNIARGKCVIGRGLCALRTKLDNGRFLYYLLKGNNKYITSFGSGAVYDAITRTSLENILIEIPCLPTQRKIASILSAYDDLIENNLRRIKILEEMAQAIYKEWFVNFRFPGHEKVKMVDSPLGKIPEGWEIVKLSNLVDCIKDSTVAGEHLSDRLYVPIDCIPKRSLTLVEANLWQEAKSSLILFQKNDILFGAMRPYFHKVCIAPFDGITRTTCFVLRPKLPELYAYSILTAFQDETVGYANAHSQGATIPYAVWDGSLSELNVLLPVHDILEKFNEVITPMLQVFQSAYPKLQNLRKTRDLLLPKLISGEVDVEELDIAVAELQ